jgi:uncharacterized protein (UPF0333 family)
MLYMGKKGQSTLEYVILIGFVVAALIAMGIYMKRGIQGKLRESTDQVGEQYSAGETSSNYTTVSNLVQVETQSSGGGSTINYQTNKQSKSGGETVNAWQ